MKNNEIILEKLDKLIPDPKCELNYNKDYELLIATILSAQSTDKRVNMVTEVLFEKYNLEDLSKINIIELENIIKPVGTFKRKAQYIKDVAIKLLNDHNGIVPNDRKYLESLPGVGRKTTNVVLSLLFNERDHVHTLVDCANDTALETGMDDLHLRLLTEELLIGLLHGSEHMRVHVGLPTAIATAELHAHSRHREAALERDGLIHLHAL